MAMTNEEIMAKVNALKNRVVSDKDMAKVSGGTSDNGTPKFAVGDKVQSYTIEELGVGEVVSVESFGLGEFYYDVFFPDYNSTYNFPEDDLH